MYVEYIHLLYILSTFFTHIVKTSTLVTILSFVCASRPPFPLLHLSKNKVQSFYSLKGRLPKLKQKVSFSVRVHDSSPLFPTLLNSLTFSKHYQSLPYFNLSLFVIPKTHHDTRINFTLQYVNSTLIRYHPEESTREWTSPCSCLFQTQTKQVLTLKQSFNIIFPSPCSNQTPYVRLELNYFFPFFVLDRLPKPFLSVQTLDFKNVSTFYQCHRYEFMCLILLSSNYLVVN